VIKKSLLRTDNERSTTRCAQSDGYHIATKVAIIFFYSIRIASRPRCKFLPRTLDFLESPIILHCRHDSGSASSCRNLTGVALQAQLNLSTANQRE
jgi:hypothetical protein